MNVIYQNCYGLTHWDYIPMDLVNFSLFFILSDCFRLWTVRRFPRELTDLTPFSQTCVCLMVNLVLLKPNFILDSSFLCCAWRCCHIHVHSSYSCFFFHSATDMWLHRVINLCYACPRQYQWIQYKHVHTPCQYKRPGNWLATPVWFSWSFLSKADSIPSLHFPSGPSSLLR